MSWIAPQSNVL